MKKFKDWVVWYELNHDASRYGKIIVQANTKRNAEKAAIKQLKKETNPFFIYLRTIEEINN